MKRILLSLVVCGVFGLILAGCGGGGGSNMVSNGQSQSVTINTGDATNDQIIAFELTVSAVTLNGGSNPSVLSKPTEVEFVHEAGTFEPLTLTQVPQGTYTGATLTLANPEVVIINASGAPQKLPATLSSTTVTVTFNPSIIIGSSPEVINLDLNLANSVTLNGNPPTSATVTPTFSVTTASVPGDHNGEDDDNGEMEDIHGSVTAVNASANPANFTIQPSQGSTITFNVDANTRFDDLTGLSQLQVGAIVEVDAASQSSGNPLATKVSLEENESQNAEEAEGIITGVTGSPATSINVAAQVENMASMNSPVAGNAITVNISSNTQFVVRADKLNLSSAPAFDASHIGKGQRIEADTANGNASDGATITADKIKLREEALVGTISNLSGNSFTLTVDSASAFARLTGATTVTVNTVSGTNLNGITLANNMTVRVRGLLFFNPSPTPPATSYTMIAARINSGN